MDMDFDELSVPDDSSVGQRVRKFMTSKGVAKHHVVSRVSELLGMERAPAYRRMKDRPAFSPNELMTIASHFGEAIETVLAKEAPRPGQAQSAARVPMVQGTPALLARGKMKVDLQQRNVGVEFAVGDELRRSQYVAVEAGSDWEIYPRGMAPQGCVARPVSRIILEVLEPDAVAVLEDDPAIAATWKIALEESGLWVATYESLESMRAALSERTFDAYVFDWYISGRTAGELLTRVRRAQPFAPIALTTGKIELAGEASLTDFSNRLGIQLLHKPVRPSWLANLLRRELASRRAVG